MRFQLKGKRLAPARQTSRSAVRKRYHIEVKRTLLVCVVLMLAACSGGGGGGTGSSLPPTPTPAPSPPSIVNVQRISADTFTNSSSQHATEVEPSVTTNGSTVVAAFQSGRFFGLGSSDISFATSFDGGTSWHAGTLPATTHYTLPPGPYDSISDPSIAYDGAHATWLIAALPVIVNSGNVPGAVVYRSQDGVTWSNPIGVTPANENTNDKSWITCDNYTSSPYYGHCYVEWDSFGGTGSILISVSTDGGQTWSAPSHPNPDRDGFDGQPVVQPNGTVIVPIEDGNAANVLAFRSNDGGATWSAPVPVSGIADHRIAGNLRSIPLISAAADASGKVYVVWQDCRFRANCASNDLVMITSSDGVTWTSPLRIPADDVTSSIDHFIPGLSIESGTSGNAHIALTFYSYTNAQCTASTCELFAGFIRSQDGGTTWGAPQALAGPMNLGWIAQTLDGAMVGDYMASTFALGRAIALIAVADPSMSGVFDEGMYVPKPGVISLQSVVRRTAIRERPVLGFHSDHAPRHIHP